MKRVHATCVAIGGRGVLIAGPSGSGKSDLALRLIDRGASLVSDDYTEIFVAGGILCGRAPAAIAGRIELRGVGIVKLPALEHAPLVLYITAGQPDRMPDHVTELLLDVPIRMAILSLLEPSAPLKVERLLAGAA